MSVVHLAAKDLVLLLRDRVALFWVLGFPLLFAFFLGAVVRAGAGGEEARFRIQVIDFDGTPASERLMRRLQSAPRLDLVESTTQVLASARADAARDAVRRAKAVAFVEIARGFSRGVGAGSPGIPSSAPSVRVFVDPSRELEGAFVAAALGDAIAELSNDRRHAPASGKLVQIVPLSAGGDLAEVDYVYPVAVLWGLIGCAACFAISMVTERTRGTFLRLAAAPIPRVTLLAGKAVACAIACVTVSIVLSVVAGIGFGVHFAAPLKVGLALSSAIVCFVGITMLLSLLGDSEQSVASAGWATLVLMAMLGGGMVPLGMMPDWLSTLSHISPVKWGILALEGAMWRGFSFAEMALPCSILWGVGLLGFASGTQRLSHFKP